MAQEPAAPRKPRSLKPLIRGALEILVLSALALLGLLLWDHCLWKEALPGLRWVRELQRLPERRLAVPLAPFAGPARVRGLLLTTGVSRQTPRGLPSALWYAWVEDHYSSGRSTHVTVLCSAGGDTRLRLRPIRPGVGPMSQPVGLPGRDERDLGVPADLFQSDSIKLLKHTFLEGLPRGRVALDLGPIARSRTVPDVMRTRCGDKLRSPRGTLHYFEASVPPGSEVTLVACTAADADGEVGLVSCPGGLGAISSSPAGLAAIAEAGANEALVYLRLVALLLLIALPLLCSTLLKRTARAGEDG